MIPLHDNVPTRRFPVVCVAIIAANIVVYLLDHFVMVIRQPVLMNTPFGVVEATRNVPGLSAHLAMVPAAVTSNLQTYWPTVFSAMFLHANLVHIGGNMLYLWIFGNNVEDVLGRGRFAAFYFIGGAAAAAAQIASGPGSTIPTIGASGAVAAVMGAYLVLYPHASVLSLVPFVFISTLMEVPAVLVIGFWALLQFANASWFGGGELQGGGVAYFAHIGGFVVGIVLILLLGGRNLVARQNRWNDWPDDYLR